MDALYDLAEAAGLIRDWRSAEGVATVARDEAVVAVLGQLGYRAETAAQIRESRARIRDEAQALPRTLVVEAGQPIPLPLRVLRAELADATGRDLPLQIDGPVLAPIATPGDYRLRIAGEEIGLAVTPPRAWGFAEAGGGRMWGTSVQIPALRGRRPKPYGDFTELAEAVDLFAARGADAVMMNPVHALFPGNGQGYSPYSPSSRLFLNGALADPALAAEIFGIAPPAPENPGPGLIDWETAVPAHLARLRAVFARLDPAARARIAAETKAASGAHPPGLMRHAVFDALDCRFRAEGLRGWQAWPTAYHDPDGPAVARFAAEAPEEIAFHAFVQWLAAVGLGAAQNRAKANGMRLGLISDLAVGVDPGGSDSWAMRRAMLDGLTIGAPPDPLGPLGQNWTLTGFSPLGLRESGYGPWRAMLRAALGPAGGVRIDHAFGLARLWVIPSGGSAADGVYLRYPFKDLLGLAALESHLAQGLVIAEDLGTAPDGFTKAIAAKGLPGMRVMWFERAMDHGFIGPQDYPPDSVAMTGTHDTATVAGWWRGRDLDWAETLGRLPPGTTIRGETERRAWDRGLLWATFLGADPRPEPDDPAPVVAAALRHIGATRSELALAPLEDLLAIEEQPNLPGTVTEHPNWRRRLDAPLADLLAAPETAARIAVLDQARSPLTEEPDQTGPRQTNP